jgi:hypothetical protein
MLRRKGRACATLGHWEQLDGRRKGKKERNDAKRRDKERLESPTAH